MPGNSLNNCGIKQHYGSGTLEFRTWRKYSISVWKIPMKIIIIKKGIENVYKDKKKATEHFMSYETKQTDLYR